MKPSDGRAAEPQRSGTKLGLVLEPGADLKGGKDAVVGTSMRYRGLMLLAAGAAALSGCGTSPASPSAPESSSGYSAPPIPGHALAGRFGSSGTSLWMLSQSSLSTSDDGGLHWSAQTLPDNVTAAAIADVAQIPNRRLWIAVPDSSGVHLYSMAAGASSWTRSLLVPTWPAGAESAGPAGAVVITPGPSSLVTVAASIPNGTDSTFSSLFTSTDDGVTFVEHPASVDSPANVVWKHVTFVNPRSGLVVGGTAEATLLHSSDGGTTWSPVSLKGLPASASYYLGNPAIVGSDVEVPTISLPSGGVGASFSLLISHDGGLTFDNPTGSALELGAAVNPALGCYRRTALCRLGGEDGAGVPRRSNLGSSERRGPCLCDWRPRPHLDVRHRRRAPGWSDYHRPDGPVERNRPDRACRLPGLRAELLDQRLRCRDLGRGPDLERRLNGPDGPGGPGNGARPADRARPAGSETADSAMRAGRPQGKLSAQAFGYAVRANISDRICGHVLDGRAYAAAETVTPLGSMNSGQASLEDRGRVPQNGMPSCRGMSGRKRA